jgi:cellobiose phosphorylase
MLYGVFGMNKEKGKVSFSPCVPEEMGSHLQLSNLQYRNMTLNISVRGYGTAIDKVYLNGKVKEQAVIPANHTGRQDITIYMGSS